MKTHLIFCRNRGDLFKKYPLEITSSKGNRQNMSKYNKTPLQNLGIVILAKNKSAGTTHLWHAHISQKRAPSQRENINIFQNTSKYPFGNPGGVIFAKRQAPAGTPHLWHSHISQKLPYIPHIPYIYRIYPIFSLYIPYTPEPSEPRVI